MLIVINRMVKTEVARRVNGLHDLYEGYLISLVLFLWDLGNFCISENAPASPYPYENREVVSIKPYDSPLHIK